MRTYEAIRAVDPDHESGAGIWIIQTSSMYAAVAKGRNYVGHDCTRESVQELGKGTKAVS